MTTARLDYDGLNLTAVRLDYDWHRTKAEAAAAVRRLHYAPEVRPELAQLDAFGSRGWVLAVEPVGDPGEGRVILTRSRGWLILCAVGCIDPVAPGRPRRCSGHEMSPAEAAEFRLALFGHRCWIAGSGTHKWDAAAGYVPAGSVYRAICVGCGEKSQWRQVRAHAVAEMRAHIDGAPLATRILRQWREGKVSDEQLDRIAATLSHIDGLAARMTRGGR